MKVSSQLFVYPLFVVDPQNLNQFEIFTNVSLSFDFTYHWYKLS